jgi:hypothetical protein
MEIFYRASLPEFSGGYLSLSDLPGVLRQTSMFIYVTLLFFIFFQL